MARGTSRTTARSMSARMTALPEPRTTLPEARRVSRNASAKRTRLAQVVAAPPDRTRCTTSAPRTPRASVKGRATAAGMSREPVGRAGRRGQHVADARPVRLRDEAARVGALEALADRQQRRELRVLVGGHEVGQTVGRHERLARGGRLPPALAQRARELARLLRRVGGDDQRALARAEDLARHVPGVVEVRRLRAVGLGLAQVVLHRIALHEAHGRRGAERPPRAPRRRGTTPGALGTSHANSAAVAPSRCAPATRRAAARGPRSSSTSSGGTISVLTIQQRTIPVGGDEAEVAERAEVGDEQRSVGGRGGRGRDGRGLPGRVDRRTHRRVRVEPAAPLLEVARLVEDADVDAVARDDADEERRGDVQVADDELREPERPDEADGDGDRHDDDRAQRAGSRGRPRRGRARCPWRRRSADRCVTTPYSLKPVGMSPAYVTGHRGELGARRRTPVDGAPDVLAAPRPCAAGRRRRSASARRRRGPCRPCARSSRPGSAPRPRVAGRRRAAGSRARATRTAAAVVVVEAEPGRARHLEVPAGVGVASSFSSSARSRKSPARGARNARASCGPSSALEMTDGPEGEERGHERVAQRAQRRAVGALEHDEHRLGRRGALLDAVQLPHAGCVVGQQRVVAGAQRQPRREDGEDGRDAATSGQRRPGAGEAASRPGARRGARAEPVMAPPRRSGTAVVDAVPAERCGRRAPRPRPPRGRRRGGAAPAPRRRGSDRCRRRRPGRRRAASDGRRSRTRVRRGLAQYTGGESSRAACRCPHSTLCAPATTVAGPSCGVRA